MARSILAVTLAVANAIAVPAAVAQTPQTTQTIGMARAVAIAQEARPGGILEAELDSDLGALVYEIEIVSDGTIHEAVIDARSGELIELEEHTIEATWLGWFDEERLAAAKQASGTVQDAIAQAEAMFGGQVVELSLEEDNDRLFWEFEIATGDRELEAYMNIQTGEIFAGEID
ncbi:PepSY domain-containing protein [Dinoroseobacter sp. PD6]|uniref:PepSY domain-containing protein n=1 Tax=Dinoroseobacter sp. PD6 TaxID=3028384 RepID=UPI00237ABD94|nr:PepSY domain-containing protein [Dinoroseobacter sp. PD6]MDD9717371.1 PepSY domain-containing protein [Dinoroseobacter sp. PD6]